MTDKTIKFSIKDENEAEMKKNLLAEWTWKLSLPLMAGKLELLVAQRITARLSRKITKQNFQFLVKVEK